MREKLEASEFLDAHDLRTGGTASQPAGIFWYHDKCVMAAHDSSAESRLLAEGAILVATLQFDRDPLESSFNDRLVDRLTAESAVSALLTSAEN